MKVSHCPAAAMRMLGFAPIREMLDSGICVSLGTDGAPSNNRMSIGSFSNLAFLVFSYKTNSFYYISCQSLEEYFCIEKKYHKLNNQFLQFLEISSLLAPLSSSKKPSPYILSPLCKVYFATHPYLSYGHWHFAI